MNIKIGPYIITQRTEYSKLQVFDKDNNNITNTEIGEQLLNDFVSLQDLDKYFTINGNAIISYLGSNIKNLFIPDDIKIIAGGSFESEDFTYVHLPESLSCIGSQAFINCRNLLEIEFPESFCGTFDYNIFGDCINLKKVVLSKNTQEISHYMFEGCKSLENINFPEGLLKIGEQAFANCISLKKITLPESVEDINDYAFKDCKKLESINIPKNIDFLGRQIFADSNIHTLIFNHSIEPRMPLCGSETFNYSKIEKLIINDTVEFITPRLFEDLDEKIKEIEYRGSKQNFKTFQKLNKSWLKNLHSAKIKIVEKSLDDITNNKDKILEKPVEIESSLEK